MVVCGETGSEVGQICTWHNSISVTYNTVYAWKQLNTKNKTKNQNISG